MGFAGGLAQSDEGDGWADDEDGVYGPAGAYDPPYDSRYAPAPRRAAPYSPYGRASAYRTPEYDASDDDDDYGGRGGYGQRGGRAPYGYGGADDDVYGPAGDGDDDEW